MAHDTTSWFQLQSQSKNLEPVRKFIMGRGNNILTDGTFNTACGAVWECGLWTIASNKATLAPASGSSDIGEELGTAKIGAKTFEVTFTVSGRTSGSVRPKFTGPGSTASYGTYVSADGTYTETIIANNGNTYFSMSSSVTFAGSISNISVREIDTDLSDRVLAWPSFGVSWDEIKPVRVSMNLANDDKAMNFMREDVTNIQNSCTLQMGLNLHGNLVVTNSGDYAQVIPSGVLDVAQTSDYTIEVNITPTNPTYTTPHILGKGLYGPSGLRAHVYGKFQFASVASGGFVLSITDPTCYTFGQTYNVIGRQDVINNFADLHVDGTLVESSALNAGPRITYTGSNYIISQSGTHWGAFRMHDARIYSRAITDAECVAHAAGIYSDDSNLEMLLDFNIDIEQSSATDRSGNGNHASIHGNAAISGDSYKVGAGDEELVTLFHGNIDSFVMTGGTINITMADKFRQLSERIIGTSNSAIDYTTSAHLVSDLAWYICTSHGNLSSVESTSNTDIDFASFQSWAAVMSGDSVLMSAKFSGTRVLEALRKISRTTHTAIYQEEDRIKFNRFSVVDSNVTNITEDELINSEIKVDGKIVTNRKYVMFDYDTTSRYHKSTIIEQDSASVNSFGLREDTEKDANIWFVDSQSALNSAQRDILVHRVPFDEAAIKMPLGGMLRAVGEMISVTDSQLGITAESFRIMKRSLSMETGMVTFNADASQIFGGFVLDQSSLDGSDSLT